MLGQKTKIAVIGAGLIGERHARLVKSSQRAELCALVDSSDSARALTGELESPFFSTIDELLGSGTLVDGVIIATPNATHRDIGLAAIEQNIPCLIEKPLASSAEDASALANASSSSGVPVLVGHHRRHHEASRLTHKLVREGKLGVVLAGQVTWCLRKPNDYFEAGPWRQQAGGGPVWINLIHEIDLLRYFLGDVASVSAMTANQARGAAVEDCAAIVLRFESGGLATVLVSDATPSPWHFEGASGENPNIAATGQDGLRLFASLGTLSFPSLQFWSHDSGKDGHWGEMILPRSVGKSLALDGEIALAAQLDHFCDIISGSVAPLVSADEGLQNIRVTEAILEAAQSGNTVHLKATA
ncbi:Gfo/Idh/MocA family protein [Pseudahrensia aquimaris]|uniref:Gfo/Idh/MocA family protein n=1 Tax=Pseudahrensia aquimaris TaxID=744461 RepID=A0ABW3FK23_9HYPH